MPRRLLMAALLAAGLLPPVQAAAAEVKASAGEPRRGGRLTVALNADIRSLEPGINRDANTDAVVHHIYEGLVGYRADLSVGPALADRWTLSEDGLTYRFTLREGARFHNGAPVTAAEVVSSWERQWANGGWSCRRQFDDPKGLQVTAVEAADAREVVYRLARPSALFLVQMANIQCGTVVSHPASFAADGKWQEAIGSGPWRLRDWRRGEFVALSRFADYKPGAAPASAFSGAREVYLDEVVFRVIPDASAAEIGLQTGAVDLLPSIEPDRVAALRAQGMQIGTAQGLGWSTLMMQTRDPLLRDVRLRRAVAHAIDLAQIAESRTGGGAGANPSAVANSSPFFAAAFEDWPAYDPAEAMRLLREAGYRGQVIRLQTNRRYPGMYDNAVVIQSMLAAGGMRVELEVLDWATQLSNYLSGRFQMQSFSFSARLDPGLMYASIVGDKDAAPWVQWEDAAAIAALSESAVTADPARRGALFRRLHAGIREAVPIIGLYYDPLLAASRPAVQGYAPQSANRMITWGVWLRP